MMRMRRRSELASSQLSAEWPQAGARGALEEEEEGEGGDSQSSQGGLGTRYSMAQWKGIVGFGGNMWELPGMCLVCWVNMHPWWGKECTSFVKRGRAYTLSMWGNVWLRGQWVWLQGSCHLPWSTLFDHLRQLEGGRGAVQVQEDHQGALQEEVKGGVWGQFREVNNRPQHMLLTQKGSSLKRYQPHEQVM